MLEMIVEEKHLPNTDSIIIEIHSPFEDEYYTKGDVRLFNYEASVRWINYFADPFIEINNNKFSILESKIKGIKDFNIEIIPNNIYYP